MQDVDEERVVLKEVVGLETAAVTNPKVGEELVVVGCEEKMCRLETTDPFSDPKPVDTSSGLYNIRLDPAFSGNSRISRCCNRHY